MTLGERGSCKSNLHKWFYDSIVNECKTFIWSGCHGNPSNRFDTELDCLAQCMGGNRKKHTINMYMLLNENKINRIYLDTLPPYATTTSTPNNLNITLITKDSNETDFKFSNGIPPPSPVETHELIFRSEKVQPEKEFMFAQNNTFIQIDGDTIKTFQLRLCREISFQFRTRLPHGLLVYHNVKNPDKIELDPYALYVIVEKGQLKVVHVFGKHSTSV